MERNNEECGSCRNSFLGRCLDSSHYGEDVSVKYPNCESYVDGRKPNKTGVGFSKTDERCIMCRYFADCDNKRLNACAYISNAMSATQVATQSLAQPLARKSIDIHLDFNTVTSVSKDELQKQIAKQIYKQLQCPFN
jgi:hypothetical protein